MPKNERIKTRFTGVFYVTSITNGKEDKIYYIRYKDNNSKHKELKIGKYTEGVRENYCNQKRNEIITKQRLGEETPVAAKYKNKKKVLLKDLAVLYFQTRKEGRSKKIDEQTFNKHLSNYFDDMEMVTKENILNLKKHLKMQKNQRNDFISDKTVNNILTLLISIIKYSVHEDYLKNDISKYITKFSISNTRERFLTKEEIEILYESVQDDKKLYVFCKLALNTGARVSTLLNITKQDIDFTHNMVTLYDFKNNSTYKGFLSNSLIELLIGYTSHLKKIDKIFENSTSLTKKLQTIINDLFNLDIDIADNKNRVVIHTLRHTFASHLAIKGTPIYTIQKLMNHKDIKMTMRYAKLAPDSGKEAVIDLIF